MKTTTSLCVCMDAYFDLSGTCTSCDYTCTTCIAAGSCATCNSTANRIKESGTNKCVCKSGYFDTGIQ